MAKKKLTEAEKKAAAETAEVMIPDAPTASATAIVKALQSLTRAIRVGNKIAQESTELIKKGMQVTHEVEVRTSEPVSINGDQGEGGTVEADGESPIDEHQGSDITMAMAKDVVRDALTSGRREQVVAALAEVGADTVADVSADRYEWLIAQVAE